MTKIVVDDELCIGCGACVSACPECFELNEDGKSQVIENDRECDCNLNEVAMGCPAEAISINDED